MSLKEATWEHHKRAETRAFVKEMFSGSISNERYALYLFNQHQCDTDVNESSEYFRYYLHNTRE